MSNISYSQKNHFLDPEPTRFFLASYTFPSLSTQRYFYREVYDINKVISKAVSMMFYNESWWPVFINKIGF